MAQEWNNGKEVPRWGVAEIQKMGAQHGSQSHGLIIYVFAVRVWSTVVYLLSRRGQTCEI